MRKALLISLLVLAGVIGLSAAAQWGANYPPFRMDQRGELVEVMSVLRPHFSDDQLIGFFERSCENTYTQEQAVPAIYRVLENGDRTRVFCVYPKSSGWGTAWRFTILDSGEVKFPAFYQESPVYFGTYQGSHIISDLQRSFRLYFHYGYVWSEPAD